MVLSHANPKEEHERSHNASIFLKPAPVLLAEDDAELRNVLADALREDGYEVTEFPDGEQLLNHLAEEEWSGRLDQIGVIVSDIRMRGLTALDLLETLQGCEGLPPVILITAFGDDETHARAHQLGAAAMFDKPFEIEALLAKVDELVLTWVGKP